MSHRLYHNNPFQLINFPLVQLFFYSARNHIKEIELW